MTKKARTILHIDMNAFFASVEQAYRPELKGKPIAVIGSKQRTVITTSSYEARAYGVKTGMNTYEAKKLCPDILFIIGDNRKYTDACMRIIAIFSKYTPNVEVFSIDEAFLDITYPVSKGEDPLVISAQIKKDIQEELDITCSIGIAPNKLLAKLASDMKKPDGLVRIIEDEIADLMKRLPVKELCGIGSQLEKQLCSMGITTCGELGAKPVRELVAKFGVIGYHLHDMGLGKDTSPVVPIGSSEETKSVGHSMTLPEDTASLDEIRKYLLQLSEMVGSRMRREGFLGRTVALTIRYKDFSSFSKRKTVQQFFYTTHDLYQLVLHLLDSVVLTEPVRLLGVSVSHLTQGALQIQLFSDDKKRVQLTQAVDDLNKIYGNYTVTWAGLLKKSDRPGVISPGWRPGGSRRHV